MTCPTCGTPVPAVAFTCHRCGAALRPEEGKRPRFAAKPDEPVASFALVSSIMPRGAGAHPQTYRIAFTVAIGVALIASLFGALPIAVLVAAFAVPIVYLTYLYDINLWEDAPLPVTGLAIVLTGALAAGFGVLWTGWLPLQVTLGGVSSGVSLRALLLLVLLVPVVGELIRQAGPVLLASRPAFDDYLDGVTFGIASGVAFAAADTIVRHWDLVTGGLFAVDPGQWAPLILLEGLVKPLIMGTASGLAAGEFSGLGKGYDGFSRRYYVAVGVAVLVNAAYALGVYLLGFVTPGQLAVCLQLVFGLVILGALILRLRVALQTGLTEGALEAAARSAAFGATAETELGFCRQCEMPVLPDAVYCSACGVKLAAPADTPVTVPAGPPDTPVTVPASPASEPTPPEAAAGGAPAPEPEGDRS